MKMNLIYKLYFIPSLSPVNEKNQGVAEWTVNNDVAMY